METELQQARRFATETTFPGLRQVLENYAATIPGPTMNDLQSNTSNVTQPAPVATAASAQPKSVPVSVVPARAPGQKYVPIDNFSWDQGSYNSPTVIRFAN